MELGQKNDHRTGNSNSKKCDDKKSRRTRKVLSANNLIHDSSIKSKLKCLNTNAQSLQYKMDELKQVIKENNVQIITVTESWGQPWKEATLDIEGFIMYRKDRTDGRKGGGCIIYISRD